MCGEKTSANPSTTSSSCVSEVERRDDDPEPVERRTAHEAHERDEHDHRDTDDDVPRIVLERMHLQRAAEIVRQEERRQRDHDQVVEEERPAGHEARQVVERAPDERRRSARLGQRGGAFGVREGDDQEERAGREQHDRREAERVGGEHA